MLDTPVIASKGEIKCVEYKQNDLTYKIELNSNLDNIYLCIKNISKIDSFYELEISFSDIQKKNQVFRIYQSSKEFINALEGFMKNKNISIQENQNDLTFNIIVFNMMNGNKENISFNMNKKINNNKDEIIKYLCTKVDTLEKKFDEMNKNYIKLNQNFEDMKINYTKLKEIVDYLKKVGKKSAKPAFNNGYGQNVLVPSKANIEDENNKIKNQEQIKEEEVIQENNNEENKKVMLGNLKELNKRLNNYFRQTSQLGLPSSIVVRGVIGNIGNLFEKSAKLAFKNGYGQNILVPRMIKENNNEENKKVMLGNFQQFNQHLNNYTFTWENNSNCQLSNGNKKIKKIKNEGWNTGVKGNNLLKRNEINIFKIRVNHINKDKVGLCFGISKYKSNVNNYGVDWYMRCDSTNYYKYSSFKNEKINEGDIMTFIADLKIGTLEVKKNDISLGKLTNFPTNEDLVPSVSIYYVDDEVEIID